MISIVIPCFNAEQTLLRCLNSVLNQTYKEYEIIIVDDGSTDFSKQIIEDFSSSNSNIKLKYFYQENSGPSAARNFGVKKSSGEYIAFLDSDDEWHFQKLELQLKIMQEKKLNFLGSRYQYEVFDSIKRKIKLQSYSFKSLLLKTQFSTPGVMMKKDFFEKLKGFDKNLKYAEDYDLWLRAALHNDLVMICEPKLVRLHKNAYGSAGLSSNMIDMFLGELKVLKKLFFMKNLNFFEYGFYNIFIFIKFIRRLIITKVKGL